MPGLTQFPATPYVGDSVNNAPVEERQPAGAESSRYGNAVRAIAIKKTRRGLSIFRNPLLSHKRDGNAGAVARGRMAELGDILCTVVRAENRRLLEQDPLPCVHVIVKDGEWRNQRLVAESKGIRVELAIYVA
jgi:hypothetical protein